MKLAVGSRTWVAALSAMTAVTALSIDMSLPAQPTLATVFEVSNETAQLTLSVFLVAFAGAQLVTGALSDRLGRKRVLVAGLAIFTLAGIACALSPSIEVLLVCRALQGIGAAASPVVARAMVRDTQPGAEAARLLSTMLAALAIAPMIAPVIGGALLDAFNWRAVFVGLALCGITLLALSTLIDETHPPDKRATMGLIRGFREVFTTPGTRLPMLVSCASFSGQFAYIGASPFILIDGYGVSPQGFALYFAGCALSLMLGSLCGRALLRKGRSPRSLVRAGVSLLFIGGVLVLFCTDLGLLGFYVPMQLYFVGVGLTSPSATALAMEPVPHLAGTASAAIGSIQMTCGAIAGYATTRIGGSDPHTFATVVVVMGALACMLGFAASRPLRGRILG